MRSSRTDQTSGEGGDFAGYTLTTTMYANPSMPQGQMSSTLSVAYPDDPAGDWTSGTVEKQITYDFQGGSSHALVQKQNYEQRTSDQGLAQLDGVMPMVVPPRAGEEALATLPDGTTPRLVLLALTGSQIPTSILAPGWATAWGPDEPSLDPTHAWTKTGGTWQTSELFALDAALDVTTQSSFRLSLVDDNGKVVPGTAFRVYRCPRAEHLTPPDVPPGVGNQGTGRS